MLKGKSAVITGSTSGIGLEIARELAAEGCNICLNGFGHFEDIEVLCEEIEDAHNVKVIYSDANLSDPSAIEGLVDHIEEHFEGIDILVNNAGVQHVCPIEDFPPEKWDLIMAVNLSAAFHLSRLMVPMMRQRGWGRIVNVASAHALVASPFKSAYVAAKHGLLGLTKTIAMEVAEQNITCNAICPGYVKTPLVEGQIKDTAVARGITEEEVIRDVMLGEQPTKSFVKVSEISGLVKFLCSDSAASITGAALPIDGGWTAH